MENKRRFILKEDNDEPIVEIEPIEVEEEPIVVEPEIVEPQVDSAVVNNAYTDMVQDILRRQWDVINACDGVVASLSTEDNLEANKEDLISVLKKIVEDTTVAIGMTTKALSVIDPKQEELMDKGVEQAEEVISTESEEEKVEVEESLKPITEDVYSISFEDRDYYERYWLEEALYCIESMLENYEPEDDDDALAILEKLDDDSLKEICEEAAHRVRNNDYVWETINECLCDAIRDGAYEKADSVQVVELPANNTEEGGE